jgi:hypothetical protein
MLKRYCSSGEVIDCPALSSDPEARMPEPEVMFATLRAVRPVKASGVGSEGPGAPSMEPPTLSPAGVRDADSVAVPLTTLLAVRVIPFEKPARSAPSSL